jgi:undecaprenyl pyrophosphate synthase
VQTLTLFAFSSENKNRCEKEVSFKGLSGKVAKNKFGQGGKQQIKILKRNENIRSFKI